MKAIVLKDPEPIEAAWTAAETTTPFQTPELARICLHHTAEPLLIVVREGTEIRAIAPWMITRDARGIRWLTGLGGGDAWYHDPLFLGDPEEATACILACLESLKNRWNVVSLNLSEESPLRKGLPELGWAVEERRDWLQNSGIELPDGWAPYWMSRESALRKDYQRSMRLLEAHSHRFLQADAQNLERLLGELFRLHELRWRAQRDWRCYQAMIRALAWRAIARRELHLYALEIENKLAALNFAISCRGCFFGFMAAYRSEYSKLGIGLGLQLFQLEQVSKAGIRKFNLGPGRFPWKTALETGTIPSVRSLVCNLKSPLGWALALKHR